MKSLATLSKYLGCYDQWKKIIQRYQLKWSNEDNTEVFYDIMGNNGNTCNSMVKWLNDTYSKLAKHYGNILLYNTLTGLRQVGRSKPFKAQKQLTAYVLPAPLFQLLLL
jgi:hypothetical protein